MSAWQPFPKHSTHEENPYPTHPHTPFGGGAKSKTQIPNLPLLMLCSKWCCIAGLWDIPTHLSILEQEQALREAGHPQKHRGPSHSLFNLQRLKEAVNVASGSSLKFGTPRPWDPNDSSGWSPGAELWLRVLWTTAIVKTFATASM